MYGNEDIDVGLTPIDRPADYLVKAMSSNTSELTEAPSTTEKTKSRSGSTMHSNAECLKLFVRQGEKPVKKEYVRVKIIRGHKGFFRYYKRKAIKCEIETLARHPKGRCLKALAELYRVYNRKFTNISRASTGSHKSYSNSFCLEYFSHEKVRESYFYYTEYLFTPLEPESLSRYFGMSCCTERVHSGECRRKWIHLKKALQVTYIEELGYSPFHDHQLFEETEDCVLDRWQPCSIIEAIPSESIEENN